MSAAAADIFLSYSRADAPAVRQIQASLKQAGLATFLDRDQLPAGQPWLPALEQAIARCAAVAVLVGPAGLGTWQQREVQLALDRQAEAERAGRSFPVIPILLPRVEDPPGGFLRLQTWVDLRADLADPTQLHVLLTGLRGHAPAEGSVLREALCPYRGLLPFREEDASLFFGRTRFVDELVAKVRQRTAVNTVAVVGRSGSGKSSVVYAGLFPALRREKGLGEQAVWDILSLRPLAEPLHQLARAFAPPPHDADPITARAALNTHADRVRKREVTVAQLVSDRLQTDKGSTRLLLYVDQWEELYTQAQPREVKTEQDKRHAEDARLFIDLLLDAAASAPCTLVLSVRSDFYPDIQSHDCLRAAVQDGQVSLGPMSEPELRAVIEGPAKAVSLRVHPDLTTRLVRDIGLDVTAGRNGQYDIRKLPLLEYALKETWRRREGQRLSLNAYGQAGGIDGAVAQRANQIFSSLSQAQQAAARRLFVSLVTPGEGREDTRARAVYPEQDDAIAAVIDKFSAPDARLLVTGEDAPSARRLVDLSHEAMIREWDLLKTWIETNREALRRREHIRARQLQWEEQGKDPTLLLPPGLPLEEGRKLLADHGDVLIEEVQPYIAASLAADEERQRQAEAAAAAERQRERERVRVAIGFCLVALLLAAIAGWQWMEAKAQTRLANAAIRSTSESFHNALILSDRSGVQRSGIGVLLTEAVTDFEHLIELGSEDVLHALAKGREDTGSELRYEYAWRLMTLADHYGIIGETERQLDLATRARDILQALTAEHPSNTKWLRQLAFSYDLVGEIRSNRMQLKAALDAYHIAQSIREKLSRDDPSDPKLRRDLSISQQQLGGILLRQEHLDEALDAFEKALDISAQLAREDPANRDWQRDLLVINHGIGDVLLAKKEDPKRAAEAYRTSLDIAKRLTADDPANTQLKRDLAASQEKIGNILEDQGNMGAALDAYQDSLSITKQLAADDPAKVDIQRDLSLGHENIGRILRKQGDLETALDHYRRSLEIRKQLAADNPSNTELQRGVLEGYDRIGELLNKLGQVQEAIAAYQASHVVAKRLAAAEPTNADWQYLSYRQLGRVRELERNKEEAQDMYCQAMKVVMTNSELRPTESRWQQRLHWLEQHLNEVWGSGACPFDSSSRSREHHDGGHDAGNTR